MAAVILISEILASPLSSILMWKSSAWLPSLLGLALEALSIFFVFLLPETRPVPKRYLSESHADDPVNNAGAAVSASLTSKLKATLSRASSYWLLSPGILSILATFLFGSIGKQALQLVIQYASVRFDWSIAEATLLITIKGIVTLVVLLFALPQLSKLLDRHMESSKRELIVVQGSACLLTAGAFTMALSATPPLFIVGLSVLACGWGFYSALRSFAIGMVQADQVGAISTAVAMVQSAGTIMSGPLLASAFGFGLSHKGVWRGMPYMVAAIFFFVATCLVYYLSRKTSHKEGYRLQSQFEDEEPNPASEG